MRINRKNKNQKSKWHALIILGFQFILVLLIVLLIISNLRIYQRRLALDGETTRKEKEIKELTEKIKDIEESSENGTNDDYQMERIAREQLLLKREGERVVFVTVPEEKEEEIEEPEKENFIGSLKKIYANVSNKIISLFR